MMNQQIMVTLLRSAIKALQFVYGELVLGIFTVLIASLPAVSVAQEVLTLDCSVSKANPVFDLAEFPEGAAIVRMEHYRFVIIRRSSEGLATTSRGANLPAKVVETENHFQICCENKHVVIDRLAAAFQVWIQGAKSHLGSGSCVPLGERRF